MSLVTVYIVMAYVVMAYIVVACVMRFINRTFETKKTPKARARIYF